MKLTLPNIRLCVIVIIDVLSIYTNFLFRECEQRENLILIFSECILQLPAKEFYEQFHE